MSAGTFEHPVFVGPYRLISRIGEGGMGVVHLALDPGGRAVAVKLLAAHVEADVDARRRLAREVETLRRVRHPNVAGVIAADLTGDTPYLVTTYVPGRTLEQHVRGSGPLQPEHVAHLGVVIADALRAVHAVGVVHRDLKPANVMLVDGEPVLIDFGIAHLVDETRITMGGIVMGTPGYLSPEVVNGYPVTAATDWWGWGATLAFASTGRAPFGVGTATEVLDRVRRGDADLAGVDARLAWALAGALVVDPVRRAPSGVVLRGLEEMGFWSGAKVRAVESAAVTERLDDVPSVVSIAAQARTQVDVPLVTRRLDADDDMDDRASWSAPATPTPRPTPTITPSATPTPTPSITPPRWDEARAIAGTILLAVATLVVLAAVTPGLVITLSVLWVVLARVVDAAVTGLIRRRYARGHRRGDVAATVALLPWRLVVAVPVTALTLIVPGLLAASVAFLVAVAGSPGDAHPGSAVPLAVGTAAGWFAAWWGPGGSALRRGSRGTVRALTHRRTAHLAVLVLLAFVCVAALLVARGDSAPDWWLFGRP